MLIGHLKHFETLCGPLVSIKKKDLLARDETDVCVGGGGKMSLQRDKFQAINREFTR